jgi:hypothetical protein
MPFLLVITFVIYERLSFLAVNRNISLILISVVCITSVLYYEVSELMMSGEALNFVLKSVPFSAIAGFFSLIIGLQPKVTISPYYKSIKEEDLTYLSEAA